MRDVCLEITVKKRAAVCLSQTDRATRSNEPRSLIILPSTAGVLSRAAIRTPVSLMLLAQKRCILIMVTMDYRTLIYAGSQTQFVRCMAA